MYFLSPDPFFPEKKVPAGIPQGSKACIFLKSPSFGHQTLFFQKKKAPAGTREAAKTRIFMVLDPKWVEMARFGLRIGQNEAKWHQEAF